MDLMRDPFFAGLGAVGMFLVIYAGVLAFFLPFYVIGIYNQAKKINKNIQTMMSLSADTLDLLQLFYKHRTFMISPTRTWALKFKF